MNVEISSVNDLTIAAKQLFQFAPSRKLFLFYGEMGAGKTTFIKAICAELGIKENVSSPTFSIVNEYQSPQGPLYHFDFYRLKNETEALDLGYEDYFYSGYYCFIEWPEKIPDLLPRDCVKVIIEIAASGARIINAQLI